MAERIIVVKEITTKQTKRGKGYLSVKGKDGNTYNIFDQMIFHAFEVDRAVKLTGETQGDYFNTTRAEKVENILEQKAAQEVASKMPDNPQELGMWWKELGECLRSGYINNTGMEMAYKAQMLSVLPITIEKKAKEGE